MKIRVLLNIGTNDRSYPQLTKGEHDVSRKDALKLIERGWAVAIEEPSEKPVKAVPGPAVIEAATQKATGGVKAYREKALQESDQKQPAHKEQ